MKTLSILTLIAVAATFVAPRAQADEEGRALLGGLIGGILIGSVLADDDIHTSVSVGYSNHGHGYYDWVSVKTWIPGHYERKCDRYGNYYKSWVSGYHTYVRQKIWVESRRPYHRQSYGNRNHHDDRRGHYDHNRRDRDSRRHDGNRRVHHTRKY